MWWCGARLWRLLVWCQRLLMQSRTTVPGGHGEAVWTEQTEQWGKGRGSGCRQQAEDETQFTEKLEANAEAEAAVEELIVFSGLDNSTAMHLARLCSDSSAPTSTHAITDTGERTQRRRRQVIVHSCVLGSNTFVIGEVHTKAARARERSNEGLIHELQKLF